MCACVPVCFCISVCVWHSLPDGVVCIIKSKGKSAKCTSRETREERRRPCENLGSLSSLIEFEKCVGESKGMSLCF